MSTPSIHIYILSISMLFLLSNCSQPTDNNNINNKNTHTSSSPSESLEETLNDSALEHALKHTDPNYICPMHPQIISDDPDDTCPLCGMDLVPINTLNNTNTMSMNMSMEQTNNPNISSKATPSTTSTTSPITIEIPTPIIQSINIRTSNVIKAPFQHTIATVGFVTYNEDKTYHIHPRASGWVEKLSINTLGETITAQQRLLEYYAPDIVNAQAEYLVAVKTSQYQEKAKEKLRLLNVPEKTIDIITQKQKATTLTPILSPQSGTVTQLNIRQGMYITPEMELYTISDLSTIWVMGEIYEQDLLFIKENQKAEIRISAYPNKVWEGKVDFIYPELDPITRTATIRLVFSNAKGLLKPNMLAEVKILSESTDNSLQIPKEAVIFDNEITKVIQQNANNQFTPITITIGQSNHEMIEVLSGLNENDSIVVSGQFLIDSEANLQASFRRMGVDQSMSMTTDPHQHHH